jgi:predicted DNA-binding WGR domain protein
VRANPDDGEYKLGILIDDDRHYRNNNLIEQYYQRPAILQSFGWKILPVFGRDWLHQPQKVMEQILKLIREEPELQHSTDKDTGGMGAGREDSGINPARAGISGEGVDGVDTGMPARKTSGGVYDDLVFERLSSIEGGSNKFWEAATDGNKLVVRWGRTGTKGQIQLKTFPDEEIANREKEKMIKEKLGKGYS